MLGSRAAAKNLHQTGLVDPAYVAKQREFRVDILDRVKLLRKVGVNATWVDDIDKLAFCADDEEVKRMLQQTVGVEKVAAAEADLS